MDNKTFNEEYNTKSISTLLSYLSLYYVSRSK